MTKIQFSPYNKEGKKRKEDDKHIILKREMYSATTLYCSNFQHMS